MTKKTPLYDPFAALGATFVARAGWEVPEVVTGWEDEYRAATTSAALSDRSHRGRIRVTGKDHVTFLHNMLTNDIRALKPGEGLEAAFLSRKGKLLSDLFVFRHDDSVMLEMEPDRVTPFTDAISRYIVSEDVGLEDESGREALLSIAGPRAAELLSAVTGEPYHEPAPFQLVRIRVGDVTLQAAAVRHGPGPGLDVGVPRHQAHEILARFLAGGRDKGVRAVGWQTLETRRIEAGIPRFGVDMDESHLLLEAGLNNAVSFTKGCYVGQEYVARQAHRGHLNRKLIGLTLESLVVPAPGDEILGDNRPAGQVTSATSSPTLGCSIALGHVHRDFFEPGTRVSIQTRGAALVSARVTELPFLP